MNTPQRSRTPSLDPSEIIKAVHDGELENVQLILDLYPESIETFDSNENNILHLSITLEQCSIFDHLLTLDKLDLNEKNIHGDTPLSLALQSDGDFGDYFALELIQKGANVNQVLYSNNTLLHFAMLKHKFIIARMLMERGADVNAQNNNGCTPLHMLFHLKTNPIGVSEGIGMMMFYGADATIVDLKGNIPFELAVLYDSSLIAAQQSLFFYSFDELSNYSMSLEVLLELLETESELFLQIADYVADIVFVKGVYLAPLTLFSLPSQFLKMMIKKFDYVITELFNGPLISWAEFKPSFLENCEILLNCHLALETVQFLGKLDVDWVVDSMNNNEISPKETIDVVSYLLTYSVKVSYINFDTIYKNFGYCDLFRLLLLMDIEKCYTKADIVPRIFYDLELTVEKFLQDPHNFSLNSLEKLMDYFAKPNLKKFCCGLNVQKLISRAERLPEVPLLLEFARDVTREFLINKYDIKTTRDYFYVIRRLPIGRIHQQILSFERKLYR